MTIRKLEIERFSITSSKLIEKVVTALKAAVGQPDLAEFAKATKGAQTIAELEHTVQKGLCCALQGSGSYFVVSGNSTDRRPKGLVPSTRVRI